LNTPAKKARRDAASYEYVAPVFTPITLSAALAPIRATLFGADPDSYFLNFRVRELLRYIHETELAAYVYALDPRVTYWPEYNNVDFTATKQIKITQAAGAPRRVSVAGQFDVNNATGRAARQYVVTLTAGNTTALAATVAELNTAQASTGITEFNDLNTAPAIPVPQTNLKLRFSNNAAPAVTACNLITELGDIVIVEDYDASAIMLENDADCVNAQPFRMRSTAQSEEFGRWLVDIRARPPAAITTILPVLELLGESTFLNLFGAATVEPYTTFKNLWFDHPIAAYKLSGLVLAFIYRCNEIYERKNG